MAMTISPAIAVRLARDISLLKMSLYFQAITWWACGFFRVLFELPFYLFRCDEWAFPFWQKVFNSYKLYCFHTCPNRNDATTSSSLAKKRTRRTPDRMARTPPTIWTPVFSLKIGIIDTTCEMIIWTCTTRGWLWHLIGQHWVFPVSLASPSSTNKDLVKSSFSLLIFSVLY